MITISQQAEALARRLADAQKVSVDAVITQALEARAHAAGILPWSRPSHDCSPAAVAARRERIERLVREIAAMPVLDPRSPNEIMDDLNTP